MYMYMYNIVCMLGGEEALNLLTPPLIMTIIIFFQSSTAQHHMMLCVCLGRGGKLHVCMRT